MWLHAARWNISLRDKWRILRARHAVRFSKIKGTPRQRPMPFTMTVGLITTLCAVTAVFAMEGKYEDVCLFWRAPLSVLRSLRASGLTGKCLVAGNSAGIYSWGLSWVWKKIFMASKELGRSFCGGSTDAGWSWCWMLRNEWEDLNWLDYLNPAGF